MCSVGLSGVQLVVKNTAEAESSKDDPAFFSFFNISPHNHRLPKPPWSEDLVEALARGPVEVPIFGGSVSMNIVSLPPKLII